MSLRTVPGMINVKTPIGSAVAEFNRARASQMSAIKEGWTAGEAHVDKAKPVEPVANVAEPKTKEVENTCPSPETKLNKPEVKVNCSCKAIPKEKYGPRAEVRGQNPNSIYDGNAPHVVEGWRAKNTSKTVKAIVIVLIIVVAIMLIACIMMKSIKPKHPIIFSRIIGVNALAPPAETSTEPITYPEVPVVDGELLFGGKKAKKSKKSKAKKCTCGKCPVCLKKAKKSKKAKKTVRKLNEVYSADDEELI